MNESFLYKAQVDMYSHLVSKRLIFSKRVFKKFIHCYTLSIYLYTSLYSHLVHYMKYVSETFLHVNMDLLSFNPFSHFRAPVKSLLPPFINLLNLSSIKLKLLVRQLSTLIPDILLRNAPNAEVSERVTGKAVLTIVKHVVFSCIVTLML